MAKKKIAKKSAKKPAGKAGKSPPAKPAPAPAPESRTQRIERLLAISTALVALSEKAVEHLPQVIEILVKTAHLAFWDDQRDFAAENSERRSVPRRGAMAGMQADAQVTSMLISPRIVADSIKDHVARRDWRQLANRMTDQFDIAIVSAPVPKALRDQLRSVKKSLVVELRAQGFEAATAGETIYFRKP